MVIIELTYKNSLDVVDKHVESHRTFLQKYYDKGLFIASGAKIPREGGIIVAHTDLNTAQELVKDDPFYTHGIADYKFYELNLK